MVYGLWPRPCPSRAQGYHLPIPNHVPATSTNHPYGQTCDSVPVRPALRATTSHFPTTSPQPQPTTRTHNGSVLVRPRSRPPRHNRQSPLLSLPICWRADHCSRSSFKAHIYPERRATSPPGQHSASSTPSTIPGFPEAAPQMCHSSPAPNDLALPSQSVPRRTRSGRNGSLRCSDYPRPPRNSP
jgi:hypothetical protein